MMKPVILRLAWKSLKNRRMSSLLAVLSMTLSTALVLGVYRLGRGVQSSFSNTLSGTDLIVGARGGSMELLLYTVFHMGQATNNVHMSSYEYFSKHPATAWTIPLSLGDSYRNHRVVATTGALFEHYRYHGDKSLRMREGRPFASTLETVLGATTAEEQDLKVGDKIVLSHGLGDDRMTSGYSHRDKPFTVVGVLAKTGTPIDKSLYISLEGMEALHVGWQEGRPPADDQAVDVAEIPKEALAPSQITAFFLGTKSRIAVLHLQREIATYEGEALSGVIPGLALSELWQQLSYFEDALSVISAVVLVMAFVGVLLSLFASLNERRREIALLRTIGARPRQIFLLLMSESFLLTLLGTFFGVVAAQISQVALSPWIEREFGVVLQSSLLSGTEAVIAVLVVALSPWVGLLPAWRAYKQSLAYDLLQRQ
jgi:putative ABC transport system permease protein